jgi:hypothetical protein
MSTPQPPQEVTTPAGWYPTGEFGPDGRPAERWWDGAQWSTAIRPLESGASGPGRRSRTKSLIVIGVIVVLVGGSIGAAVALNNSSPASTASTAPQSTPTTGPGGGLGNGNGGLGGGGGGLGAPSPSASPMPTVTGGSGQTVADPIDGLAIPVPSGWTATAGSATGQGSWPELGIGPYTCPSGLAQSNGSGSAAAQCTRGGLNFATTSGTTAQSVATTDIATLAKSNYGTLTSHTVVNQGAVTVAGRAGYQVTWSVVPSYTGPSGTVEVIAIPVPSQSGYFTLIDIGLDQSAQAPSLSSVNSQIISKITESSSNSSGT